MPRWRKLCKEGEQPSEWIGVGAFQRELGCKHPIGWSQVPTEWVPAIKELVANIRKKYTVDGCGIMFVSDDPQDINTDICIAQIKDKFGSLRFYYEVCCTDDIDAYEYVEGLIGECEERLKKDDPYYGVPY